MDGNFHEEFHHDAPVKEFSDKSFGLTGGFVFLFLAIIKGIFLGPAFALFFFAIGACFFAATFLAPTLLAKPKAAMIKAAPYIARVLNPVLMGFLFLLCFIPGGIVMKILRRDLLNREYDPFASTYWTKRAKHDLPEPMKYQF